VNQVHLIVIAEVMCHLGPRFSTAPCLAVQSCFEPCNPGVELRLHPDLLAEPTFKLTQVEANLSSKTANLNLASVEQDFIRRRRDTIGAGPSSVPHHR